MLNKYKYIYKYIYISNKMNFTEFNNLEDLFNRLISVYAPNIKTTINGLTQYKGTDWKLYLYKCVEPNDETRDGKFYKFLINSTDRMEMYLIIWHKGAESTIHDHPIEGCVVKVLEGELFESSYMNVGNKNCVFFKNSVISQDNISNKTGNMILHKIQNTSDSISASLHVYMSTGFQSSEYTSI